jgi:hypothetical protein
MDNIQSKPTVGIPTAAAIIALFLMLYAAAYIALGEVGTAAVGPRTVNVRVYSYEWQEYFFRPGAKVESALTAREIDTAHRTN